MRRTLTGLTETVGPMAQTPDRLPRTLEGLLPALASSPRMLERLVRTLERLPETVERWRQKLTGLRQKVELLRKTVELLGQNRARLHRGLQRRRGFGAAPARRVERWRWKQVP